MDNSPDEENLSGGIGTSHLSRHVHPAGQRQNSVTLPSSPVSTTNVLATLLNRLARACATGCLAFERTRRPLTGDAGYVIRLLY